MRVGEMAPRSYADGMARAKNMQGDETYGSNRVPPGNSPCYGSGRWRTSAQPSCEDRTAQHNHGRPIVARVTREEIKLVVRVQVKQVPIM